MISLVNVTKSAGNWKKLHEENLLKKSLMQYFFLRARKPKVPSSNLDATYV